MLDARVLTGELKGKWYGRYGLVCCPAHSDSNPSLTLTNGTDGRLLLHCKAGCGYPEILSALRQQGLLDRSFRSPPPSPAEIARRQAQDEADAAKRERQAQAVWSESLPVQGTLAETYLRGRGINCSLPDSLRFHPSCWHASAKRLPALVGRVDGLKRLSVHRTYLRADGSGKSDVTPAKAMLGRTMGGAVCVHRAAGPLVVAEGIETALSLASGLLRVPVTVWAALSAPGMAGLRLPDGIPHRLTIAPDGDTAGRDAAHTLAERATALGWTVSLLPAPDGRDWNDVLMMKGAAP